MTAKFVLFYFLTLYPFVPAKAELGGSAATIDLEHIQLKSTAHIIDSSSPCFDVHTLFVNKTLVRQFVNPVTGKVFALNFVGPLIPNLQKLAGSHFDEWQTSQAISANSKTLVTRHHQTTSTESGQLSVKIHRSLRQTYGALILKTETPACVQPGDLKP